MLEIERKFLVVGDAWRQTATSVPYRQGYLATEPERNVRVRLAGPKAKLTIKGKAHGIARIELEYPIPVEDAELMLDRLCHRPLIEKTRHTLDYQGHEWVIDEFEGVNQGLVVAEIELEHEDQPFPLPPWAGDEVTHDPRYLNANLVARPYSEW